MVNWSKVRWHIYKLGDEYRVSHKEFSPKQLRPGETREATVVGVSRSTVLSCLRQGVPPGGIQRMVSQYSEAQRTRAK